MKRFAISLVALAALVSVASCSSSDAPTTEPAVEPTTEPAVEPTTEPTAAADRFEVTYNEVAVLLAALSKQPDSVSPTTTKEANAAAGLDETTPLLFADYTVDPADENTGAFCLADANGTFVSFAYSGAAGESTLGDGDCSYDALAAEVVGDVATDEWSKGGDMMGDLLPTAVLGS
jgi:hypothetical protein